MDLATVWAGLKAVAWAEPKAKGMDVAWEDPWAEESAKESVELREGALVGP